MTFEYRNAANDRLAVAPLGDVVWLKTTPGGCEVPPDRAEEVVAGIRDAARQAAGQTTTTEPDALRCNWAHTRHAHAPHDWEPQPGMQAVRCPGHNAPAVEQPAEAQPADRAAVLREVAAMFEAEVNDCPAVAGCPPCDVRSAFAARLRRMADGTES